uniref:Uncharacterized protein n=1 Tax=Plectus sambesii TaxID=2011161 RepID=A0A914X3Y2_9BILA
MHQKRRRVRDSRAQAKKQERKEDRTGSIRRQHPPPAKFGGIAAPTVASASNLDQRSKAQTAQYAVGREAHERAFIGAAAPTCVAER